MHIRQPTRPALLLLLCSILLAPVAGAVDGVIEINQTCAVNTGCFAGDSPGFPVDINAAGSYRLTSDLSLTDADSGIRVSSSNVSIDLNGFTIGFASCLGNTGNFGIGRDSSGLGVSAIDNITVENGTIQSVCGIGIRLISANSVRIRNMHVSDNFWGGIDFSNSLLGGFNDSERCVIENTTVTNNQGPGIYACAQHLVAVNNTVTHNQGFGIQFGTSATVRGNVVAYNAANAIFGNGGVIDGNTVSWNTGTGISTSQAVVTNNLVGHSGNAGIQCFGRCVAKNNMVSFSTGFGFVGGAGASAGGFGDNVFTDNNGGTGNPQVSGGIEIGTNVCDGNTTCP